METKKKKKKMTVTPIPKKVTRAKDEHHLDEFTAFDTWLAGLSDQTFKQIQDADFGSYEKLLEHPLPPRETSDLRDDLVGLGDKARNSRQARRRRIAP